MQVIRAALIGIETVNVISKIENRTSNDRAGIISPSHHLSNYITCFSFKMLNPMLHVYVCLCLYVCAHGYVLYLYITTLY